VCWCAPGIPRPDANLAQLGTDAGCGICEVLKDDGEMARLPDLVEFARKTQGQDRDHCRSDSLPQPHESLVERVTERPLDSVFQKFKLVAYRDKSSHDAHIALVMGTVTPGRENAGEGARNPLSWPIF